MNKKAFKERLILNLKIRMAGAVCSFSCLMIRAAAFAKSGINPLIMLVPYVLAVIMGFLQLVVFALADSGDDVDSSLEAYRIVGAEFHKAYAFIVLTEKIMGAADICVALLFLLMRW